MVPRDELISMQKPIVDIMEEIELHLKPNALTVEAEEVRYLLMGLNGAVIQYLKEKQEIQTDSQQNDRFKKMETEFKILEKHFKSYKQKWMNPQAIEQSPEVFIDESKVLFTVVYKFFNKEQEVYLE